MRVCAPSPPPNQNPPQQVIKVDTLWLKGKDSIVYKPGKVKIIPGDTVYKDVDTLAILKDYFAKVIYEDTIKLDSFGYVLVKDTVSQNRIQDRTTIKNYKFPVITKTITNTIIEPPKNQVYIGVDMIVSQYQPISYFGASLTLKTKKDKMYNGGVGLTPNDGIGIKAGMSWKIKLH